MRLSLASAWHALRFGSTMPTRCALAITALLFSVSLLVAPDSINARPLFAAMLAGHGAQIWAAVFGADALLLICRIVDTRPRVGFSRLINAGTCGLWCGYVAATVSAVGYFGPDDAAEVALAMAAAWCALRTDLTVNDRETA